MKKSAIATLLTQVKTHTLVKNWVVNTPSPEGALLDFLVTEEITPSFSRFWVTSWFIDFFLEMPSEKEALNALCLLNRSEKKTLHSVIEGSKINLGQNLLHLVFSKQSSLVIRALLDVVETLPENEQIQLFTKKDLTDQSPVDCAFARKNGIGELLFSHLVRMSHLTRLLCEVSLYRPLSVMHQAVLSNNTGVVALFLEQQGLGYDHSDFNKTTTMLQLALEKGHKTIAALLYAAPVLHQIKEEQCGHLSFAWPKENTEVTDVNWSQKKTLLHFAVLENSPSKVRHLLEYGASFTAEDARGQTALESAIANNYFETVYAITSFYPLPNEAMGHLLARTLGKISFPLQRNDKLEEVLSQKGGSLLTYCQDNKDSLLLFLTEVARYLTFLDNEELVMACKQFLVEQLGVLQKKSNAIEYDAIQLQLIGFLFSLSTERRNLLIAQCTFSEPARMQLALTLLKGSVKALFLSHFSEKEHYQNYQQIKALTSLDPVMKQNIALYYFQQAHLAELPPLLLKELASTLPFKTLLQSAQKRSHPVLNLLALEKALTETTEKTVSMELLHTLHQEMQLPEKVEKLPVLLNLITDPLLKVLMRSQLENNEPLMTLALKFPGQFELQDNSLLCELLTEKTCTLEGLTQPGKQKNLEQLLSCVKPASVKHILNTLKKNVEPHLIGQSYRKTPLSKWFLCLELAPLLKELGYLRDQLLEKDPNDSALKQGAQLSKQIYNRLFTIHLAQKTKAWDDKMDSLLKQLVSLENTLAAHFITESGRGFSVSGLAETIATHCKAIDEDTFPKEFIRHDPLFIKAVHRAVIEGISTNPQSHALLDELIHWTFFCGHSVDGESLYTKMPALLRSTQANDWLAADATLLELISQKEGISSLLFELQFALELPLTMEALLITLMEIDDDKLTLFVNLCAKARLTELQSVFHYVILAKNQGMEPDVIRLQCDSLDSVPINAWLREGLYAIERYCSVALSLKILKESVYCEAGSSASAFTHVNRFMEKHADALDAKAIHCLMAMHEPLLTKPSPEGRDFIVLLSNLFQTLKLTVCYTLIEGMSEAWLHALLSYALMGLHTEDVVYEKACLLLLDSLCHIPFETNPRSLDIIKNRLGQQDLSFLQDATLIAMATRILNQKEGSLMDWTVNGIWIQRLLCSPEFIAQGAKAIGPLIALYRRISLTLKQDELQGLTQWLKGHVEHSMRNIHQDMMKNPHKKAQLLDKRKRLLAFRADSAVTALFNQLEDNCTALKKSRPELAEQALTVLYGYYNENIRSMRSDLLFKVTDFAIAKAMAGKGDIQQAQSALLQWMTDTLPFQNFWQKELSRKKEVFLYNKEGKEIAFINELNQVMAFVDYEPRLLLEIPGIEPSMCFYDKDRCISGILTSAGTFQHENVFQKNTSALLIAKVPVEQFKESGDALDLLFNDVLTENSINKLYKASDPAKHAWITEKLDNHLAQCTRVLDENNLATVINQHPTESLLPLLAQMVLQENGKQLLFLLLEDKEKRAVLLSEKGLASVFHFLSHQEVPAIFASFLEESFAKPWFNEGLLLFALYAKTKNQPELLIHALLILNQKTFTQKTMKESLYDGILSTLITSEACAKVVWNYFLKARKVTDLHQVDEDLAEEWTGFFYKQHCLAAISQLLLHPLWPKHSYRLVLLILLKQPSQIFKEVEDRFAESSWSGEEIAQISHFTRNHFHQPDNPDKGFLIGQQLLEVLVFRAANFGQTHLFYENKILDRLVVSQILSRKALHKAAIGQYLWGFLPAKAESLIHSLLNWFETKEDVSKEETAVREVLEDNQPMMDWKALMQQTWEMNGSENLSLMSAYLINYCGPKEPLVQLIKDYINQSDKANLQAISKVMHCFPTRDFSAGIFLALEEQLHAHPDKLDKPILKHMAQFFSQHFLNQAPLSPASEMAFLRHLGQQKAYMLVKHSCDLLLKGVYTPAEKKWFQKVRTEAIVENQLNQHKTSWYYSPYKTLLRLWNYGIYKRSQVVVLCEEETHYQSPAALIKEIKTPEPGGQFIAHQLRIAKQNIALRARYKTFIEQHHSRKNRQDNQEIQEADKIGFFLPSLEGCKEKKSNSDEELNRKPACNPA
ncbi:MAG: hypothetical protein WC785_07490 [Tatlockia sp.]|jgi:hypothetical protein